jgi:2-dehydropantoate 2-reductase
VKPRLTVIGAGAIGGTIGALLARGGEQVSVVDSDPSHVRAINETGLTIEGPDRPFTVALRAYGWDELHDLGDLVLIAVKAQFTRAVLDRLEPMLSASAMIVTLQNGLTCRQVADRLGANRTLAALVNLFADYIGPGHVRYYYPGEFVLGELSGGNTGRLDDVVHVFRHWGPVEVSDNIEGLLWTKLGNAAMLAATALVDTTIHEAVDHARALMVPLAAETYAVAAAEGARLEPLPYFDPAELVRSARSHGDPDTSCLDGYVTEFREHAKPRSGIWRDIVVRKRETEVGAQLGFVVARAGARGIPTPLTTRLVQMIGELEQGERAMSWANLEELGALANTSGRSEHS